MPYCLIKDYRLEKCFGKNSVINFIILRGSQIICEIHLTINIEEQPVVTIIYLISVCNTDLLNRK